MNKKLFYTPEEFRKLLPCSRAVMYEALHQGKIRSFRLGRKIYIPASEIERLNQLPEDTPNEVVQPHPDFW